MAEPPEARDKITEAKEPAGSEGCHNRPSTLSGAAAAPSISQTRRVKEMNIAAKKRRAEGPERRSHLREWQQRALEPTTIPPQHSSFERLAIS